MNNTVQEEKTLQTGTTTIGIMCKDGVVLAADKRVTFGGQIRYKKDYEKIVIINDDMALTTAGGVSDVQLLVKILKAQLDLERLRRGRKLSVKAAASMLANLVYHNIRKFSAIPGVTGFLFGGRDDNGKVYLFDIGVDGSLIEFNDYVLNGSGFMFATGVIDSLYKKDILVNDGVKLAVKAINAALQRDTATGDGIDVIVINKDGAKKVLTKQIEYALT